MNSNYIILGAAVAASFGAGFLINRESNTVAQTPPPTETPATTQKAKKHTAAVATPSKVFTPSAAPATVTEPEVEENPDDRQAERDARREEFRKQMTSRMSERQKKAFDVKISALVEKLGLDPAQEEQLRAHYATKLEAYEELMGGGFENFRDMNSIEKMASITGDGDLDGALAGILSPEQSEEYSALKQRERTNKVEAAAMQKMASLQSSLDLDEAQKDAVYEILHADAEKSVDNSSPISGMLSQFGGGFINASNSQAIEDRMKIEMETEGMDQETKKARMEESRQKRIDEKVNRFDGVLSEPQLKQYRKQLENDRPMFGGGWGGGRGRR